LPAVRAIPWIAALAALFGATACAPEASGPLVENGRRLYRTGESARGSPTHATIVGGIRAPGRSHPCVQCHAEDGRGGREAGAVVPDIRWDRLTAPYGVPDARGSWRPAYTPASLVRAIREGIDAAGRTMSPAMPRYDLGDADLDDLLAFLREIGSDTVPGVTEDAVRVAALLPLVDGQGESGRAVARLLDRFAALLNAAGGIHGRRLVVDVRDCGATPAKALETARALVESPEAPFAVVASAGLGAAPEVLTFLDEQEVPILGPLTFAPIDARLRSTFAVLASLPDQARAAARHLAGRRGKLGPHAPVAVVASDEPRARESCLAFVEAARRVGLRVVGGVVEPSTLTATVARSFESGAEELVLFGSSEHVAAVISEADRRAWRPETFVASVLAGRGLAPGDHRIVWILPPVWRGAFPGGAADLDAISPASDDASVASPMSLAAFAAARLLAHGLRESGRELRVAGFVKALEATSRLETGVTPALRFGPNRHAGARGALFLPLGSETPAGAAYVDVDDV
jgi:ABC-type branched-subunit amino acid transport system substrate-binding protein